MESVPWEARGPGVLGWGSPPPPPGGAATFRRPDGGESALLNRHGQQDIEQPQRLPFSRERTRELCLVVLSHAQAHAGVCVSPVTSPQRETARPGRLKYLCWRMTCQCERGSPAPCAQQARRERSELQPGRRRVVATQGVRRVSSDVPGTRRAPTSRCAPPPLLPSFSPAQHPRAATKRVCGYQARGVRGKRRLCLGPSSFPGADTPLLGRRVV